MARTAFNLHSFKRQLQKAMQPIIHDMVVKARADFIAGRLVRCAGCGLPLPASVCAVVGCSVCIFTTGRCMDCGGEEGAIRSIKAHFRALAWKESRRKYGDSHYDAMLQISHKKKEKSRYLHLVRSTKE
jgi:hypothetical protein